MAELFELDCVVCDVVFKAKRPHARFCSEACRSRWRRSNKPVTNPVKKPVAPKTRVRAITDHSGVVVPPARWVVASDEGRADGKPIRPLSDEEYAVRLERHLAGCVDGHDWRRWPAGTVECRRCWSQLVEAPR